MQLGRWCRGEGVVGGGWLVGGLVGDSRSDVSALRARGESRYANTRQRSASGGKRAENESRIPEEIHKGMETSFLVKLKSTDGLRCPVPFSSLFQINIAPEILFDPDP
uniref:Uncharacterized protein n=1 Tax=Vespula pensylvanica TaxID=30213 RepID=A0A834U891_VESPE|nr:hypothetical protein H0235_009429 [Vespula pensylvanica]